MKKFRDRFIGNFRWHWSGRFTGLLLKRTVLALLLIGFSAGMAEADELLMKNGDRLQGSVVSMSKGKLVFKTSYAGDITIKWDEIARITTENPMEASLGHEKTLTGRISVSGEDNLLLEPADGSSAVPITMAEIKGLEPPKPPPGWEFNGNITAGASKETGNTDTEKYNLTGNLTISKLPDVIRLYGEFYKEWGSGKLTKDNALGSATYERFLTKRWFLFGNGMAQMDKFKDLDLQGSLAAGAGYQFFMSKDLNLSARLGPAYGYEKYSKNMDFLDGKDNREYFAGYWALDFDMWFFERFFQIYHHDDLLYDFQDSSTWTVHTRTGIRIPMVLKLFASFQFNYDWVNQQAEGKTSYDQSWVFGVGWAF
ncbi:MAG: DUF481 domain-containing protein [Deltaproteobacteria bacterium]|nr:DUF481 domain-containing protein [Deltaproteobacteria bacterium]MBW2049075.1 DUF481 domain-containing protein [Deltaproteobacteria bacterium]MBW2112470.1 DUF481 domain-containing protein [Deltaproteobacteria bacterium]MBW2354654.1 DUF481 domain-containing protein [Deltaproteobacteria bacterium]